MAPTGKLAILVGGGPAPGINSVIGAATIRSVLEGVEVVGISVDSPAESQKLCQSHGYTFPFLSDPKAETIREYGVLHAKAGESGEDIAMRRTSFWSAICAARLPPPTGNKEDFC